MQASSSSLKTQTFGTREVFFAVLVAALGYFVDVYDLVLFSIVRIASLKDLGVGQEELLTTGVFLLNMQMIGMLVGGVVWGIFGDKCGRLRGLFGSIAVYSLANIANALVTTVDQYALLRFIAGMGLAGEVGAAVTLISEVMPKEKRSLGTTIVTTVGVMGAVVAALVGDMFAWRISYVIGGVLGLLLLVLRVSTAESPMFRQTEVTTHVRRGDMRLLFATKERTLRYLRSILVGLPVWFLVGILVSLSPEIGAALGVVGALKVSTAVLSSYLGFTCGDLASGLISHFWRNRKRTLLVFVVLTCTSALALLCSYSITAEIYYRGLFIIGFFGGYWAVFLASAAEQFGTNLRVTVVTTCANFVRGSTVPMTWLFTTLKPQLGVVGSAQTVCCLVGLIAISCVLGARETFGVPLDYVEE